MLRKLLSGISAAAGIGLLITEYVRGYNAGVYADTHRTVGRFDLLDGLIIVGGLVLILLAIGIYDLQKLPTIRKRG